MRNADHVPHQGFKRVGAWAEVSFDERTGKGIVFFRVLAQFLDVSTRPIMCTEVTQTTQLAHPSPPPNLERHPIYFETCSPV